VTDAVRVEVVISPGCHLCDDACAIVAEVCAELGVGWSSRELGELDAEAQIKWREYTPVILVDGAVHDVFRVTRARLRAALT
jgi:Glutaredoxin-like domain (DUF836)